MTTQIANDLEKHVADTVNAQRAAAGLDPLKVEVHLNDSAQAHANWMADNGATVHEGELGSEPEDRIRETGFPMDGTWKTAENVASGPVGEDLDPGDLDRLHELLMGSEGHRNNILADDVSYIGVGVALSSDGDTVYLTENFGETDGEVLVQEPDEDGEEVVQAYEDGEPVGAPEPLASFEEDPGTGAEDRTTDPNTVTDDDDDDGTATAGTCFVATAAYGSRSHPDVVGLRRYRDEVLVRHAPGRAAVRAYWIVGPRLARLVCPAGVSGRVARALLAPLARGARARVSRR